MTGPALNRMLELRIKDLAARPPEMNREERRKGLLRALNLEPLPPRTDLHLEARGTIQGEGYRIERLAFQSRPGLRVTAHLYRPEVSGRHPLVLRPTDDWPGKKSDPIVQASAIGLVRSGFAVFVVDAPGRFGTGTEAWDERQGMQGGRSHAEHMLGASFLGVYAWDLVRALDAMAARDDIDLEHVGIVGAGSGALAGLVTFAIEDRIRAAVVACGFANKEDHPRDRDFWDLIPGGAALGDRSDLAAIRAERGALMVLSAEEDADFPAVSAAKKEPVLRRAFGSRFRHERFPFGHDYDRRMREATLAFLREHLMGGPERPYSPEPLPLTDGHANPAPAVTREIDDPELWVLAPEEGISTLTFADLTARALDEPYPQPYEPLQRLAPWHRYGPLPKFKAGGIAAIHDEGLDAREEESVALPVAYADLLLCADLGLSVAEFFAQLVHLALPGAARNWEERALGADALTSLVASIRTLAGEVNNTPPPGLLIAQGPVCSLAAQILRKYRPELTIQTSHTFGSWKEAAATENPALFQPQARYVAF